MHSKTNSASGEWTVSARVEAPFVRPAQTFVTAGTTKPSTWPVDELYAAYANDP